MMTSAPDHLPPSRQDDRLRAPFWIATGIFIIGAILFQTVDIDLAVGDWFYQDGHFIGRGSFWADKLIHKKGGQFIVGIALTALTLLAASLKIPRLVPWRRAAVYLLCSLALGSGLVGGLKSVTNVDCPWDLARYGGAKAFTRTSLILWRGEPAFPAGTPREHSRCLPSISWRGNIVRNGPSPHWPLYWSLAVAGAWGNGRAGRTSPHTTSTLPLSAGQLPWGYTACSGKNRRYSLPHPALEIGLDTLNVQLFRLQEAAGVLFPDP